MPQNPAPNPAPGFRRNPDYSITVEAERRHLRVEFGGETLVDTRAALLLREGSHSPVWYVPVADVRAELIEPSERSTHCPYKGDASYWTVRAGERTAEDAVWSYVEPFDEMAAIRGHMAFYWDRMDGWYVDGRKVDRPG